jgi:hypothetical protein
MADARHLARPREAVPPTGNADDALSPEDRPTRPFEGDRGIRTTGVVPMEDYFAFGSYVHMYQHEHPDTLIRVTQQLNSRTRTGEITVRWWQRGTEPPL